MEIEIREIKDDEVCTWRQGHGVYDGIGICESGFYAITPFGLISRRSIRDLLEDIYNEDGKIDAEYLEHGADREDIVKLPLSKYAFLEYAMAASVASINTKDWKEELVSMLLKKPHLFSNDSASYIATAMSLCDTEDIEKWARIEYKKILKPHDHV